MKKFRFALAILSIFLVCLSSFSQSRKQLEKKRSNLKKEIKKVNSLLIKTKKRKTNALDDLKDLSQKISIRERLIETITLENDLLNREILKNQTQIDKNDGELAKLKLDYQKMVVKTYKSKSLQSKTMFLLSSESFYQAYKRVKYMQQYNDFRKKQGEEILVKTKEIKKLNDSLLQRKKVKERLITEEKDQNEAVEKDKKNQEKLISSIKKQENRYKKQLLKKQKEEKRIAARIDRLIRNAIAKANKAKGAKKSAKFALNSAEKALRANFEQNKGSLPWPVSGIITRKYGVQPHPTFPGISINSTGLHIAAEGNADAKSIFNGEVMSIQSHPDGKRSVYVRHGNYISVYNSLETIYVKKGDPIKTGSKLGKIFTDKITGKTKLSFVLYKNTTRLNPQEWIQ
ncbi:Septal ring factor EnvC, activator of murein hydrolases AmiA and AmiB [Tenacibaculum sp. MAR_2009_124]|uniref:murein hydrolase activator EnvC family protein n=1 Tax=Tenacibaculum sp. MAR_2009_124 TaxID=1250059 RepID=UPI000896CBCE|nr:peptidoglycan DD-metalloendopeptidase family protein [Tenacibaculum sp. MAR_2009_124]SEC40165.1 Septal ring factor EnvC, activator of murein hydrolases AmiA and AmiB [Tenacibaculum sp. MAR_2009_124]